MADIQAVFDEIRATRVELCGKIDKLTSEHATTRVEAAALSRGFTDHAGSEAYHPKLPERPCEAVKRLDKRLWGLLVLVLVAVGKAAWDMVRGQ